MCTFLISLYQFYFTSMEVRSPCSRQSLFKCFCGRLNILFLTYHYSIYKTIYLLWYSVILKLVNEGFNSQNKSWGLATRSIGGALDWQWETPGHRGWVVATWGEELMGWCRGGVGVVELLLKALRQCGTRLDLLALQVARYVEQTVPAAG